MRNPLTLEQERVTAVLFYGIVLLLGYVFFRIVTPFLAPLGWAAVVAVFVYPWHQRLIPRYGHARAAVLTTVVVTVLIVGPGLVILGAFVQESRAALSIVDRDALAGQLALLEQAWNRIRVFIPGAQATEVRGLIDEAISRTGGFLAARVGGLLADIVVLLFELFLTLFALFFFLRDADGIMRHVRRALPFENLRSERMIRQTRDLVYASIAAALAIASLQGLAGGLVFAVLGLGAPVFWGVMMGFLALFPFVGTWVVWVPAAVWLIATGQVVKGVDPARSPVILRGGVHEHLIDVFPVDGEHAMNTSFVFGKTAASVARCTLVVSVFAATARHRQAVLHVAPVEAFARPAPPLHEPAGRIELEHRRRRTVFVFRRHRSRAMQHSDVIVSIHMNPCHDANGPVVRQLGRPLP